MPRKSRIEAPEALNHIIAGGIERRAIFRDDTDRDQFIERLAAILIETKTRCYAWALMDDHFHVLIKTGDAPVATLMRRLLTGHAMFFNRRHRRRGPLFLNRYKSILCQEDVYLTELVPYIHLNPLRAGAVQDMDTLDRYPYSSHSALMGHEKRDWQDMRAVLNRFGESIRSARKQYRKAVQAAILRGRRGDLIGGGLIRSAGGWARVKERRHAGVCGKSDERILGDFKFVEEALTAAKEHLDRKSLLKASGVTLDTVAARVLEVLKVKDDALSKSGKQPQRVNARSLYCYWAARELGISMSALARKFGLSGPAVSRSVLRGEKLAEEEGFQLLNGLKTKIAETG